MDSDTVQLVAPRHRSFLPLFFALAGSALLHPWLYLMGANYRAHLAAGGVGALLAAWSALPVLRIRARAQESAGHAAARPALLPGAPLLLVLGAAFGMLVAHGSLILLGLGALALHCVPWARLPAARRHPALPCAVLAAGFGAGMLAGASRIDVMFLPLATWACWLCSCAGLVQRAACAQRAPARPARPSTIPDAS